MLPNNHEHVMRDETNRMTGFQNDKIRRGLEGGLSNESCYAIPECVRPIRHRPQV